MIIPVPAIFFKIYRRQTVKHHSPACLLSTTTPLRLRRRRGFTPDSYRVQVWIVFTFPCIGFLKFSPNLMRLFLYLSLIYVQKSSFALCFLSVAPVPGTTNYVWAVPHQAQIIAGQGTNSVVVSFKVKQGDVTVKATNQCGAGPLSVLPVEVVKCFHSNNAVMKTNSSKEEVLLYPNPSKEDFNCIINSDSELLFSLLVYDYAGRIVELKENIIPNENFTFGNNLAPGFYFVEINNGEGKEIFKIVKME
jgi:hypothetical protein